MVALHGLCFEHLLVVLKLGETCFQLTATRLEFLQRERLRLVRIYEALDATLDLGPPVAEIAPMGLSFLAAQPTLAKPLHRVVEHFWFAEQLAQRSEERRVGKECRSRW